MNIRICFVKYGRLRFLGHLDVMRFFQRAIARSGVPIAYSQGFHPHMIMSFAQPLALSMTSDGEYFDCELSAETVDPEKLADDLRGAMCDGFTIRSVSVLPEREPNTKKQTGMSQIAGAMYLCEPVNEETEQCLEDAVTEFAAAGSACIEKKGKSGMRSVDVRSGVHAIGLVAPNGTVTYLHNDEVFDCPDTLAEGWGYIRSEHAIHRDGAVRFLFAVDAGSENNISAEMIAQALRNFVPTDDALPERFLTAHRMELYGMRDEHMVSLSRL